MSKRSPVEDILRATPVLPALQANHQESYAIQTLASEVVELKARLSGIVEAVGRDNQTIMIIVEFLRAARGDEFAREWAAAVRRVQSPASAETEQLAARLARLEDILLEIVGGKGKPEAEPVEYPEGSE